MRNPRRVLVLVGVVALGACRPKGPTEAQIQAERTAHGALLDYMLELDRLDHACDQQKKAQLDALKANMAVLNDSTKTPREKLALSAEFDHEGEIAKARREACENDLPKREERFKEFRRLSDAWMDTCLLCGTGRACVDAERGFREPPDSTELKSWVEQRRRAPACAAPGDEPQRLAAAK